MSDLDQKRAELMALRQARHPNPSLTDYECPLCGWHVSSHAISSYGLDCPFGTSPAAKQGRLLTD